jgi:ATP-binding cassette subfamily B protein
VDDEPLQGQRLHTIRKQIAWIDPSVQLWNRSLYENIRYGTQNGDPSLLDTVIQQADLLQVLEKLPAGVQTPLGEGGGLVSGGEGQRVRLGRGMFRPGVRLVILDEPFRGLDREKRRELLRRVRQYWREATIIFISHDVGEAMTFQRVVIVENGQIAEDDAPQTLIERPNSRYRALAESEEAVRQGLWSSTDWRRLWLEQGQLRES